MTSESGQPMGSGEVYVRGRFCAHSIAFIGTNEQGVVQACWSVSIGSGIGMPPGQSMWGRLNQCTRSQCTRALKGSVPCATACTGPIARTTRSLQSRNDSREYFDSMTSGVNMSKNEAPQSLRKAACLSTLNSDGSGGKNSKNVRARLCKRFPDAGAAFVGGESVDVHDRHPSKWRPQSTAPCATRAVLAYHDVS